MTEFYCAGSQTLWYSFTAPADRDYVAYTAGSNFDSYVGWFTTLDTGFGCDDDTAGSVDGITPPEAMTNGQQLWVQVSHFETTFDDIRASSRVGVARVDPTMDDFADAPSLTFAGGADTAVKVVDADIMPTTEVGEPTACGGDTMDATST